MPQGEIITHEGIVLKVPGDGTADVEIITMEACATCHAKSVCSAGKTDTRIITVKSVPHLNQGDHVTVEMQQSLGFRALAIGYVLPFLVLITAFTMATVAGAGELVSALLSFAAIGLYYFAVWLLRNAIGKKFEFKIKV
jgi:sigma-E factor negative regulatory protein RseC